ncbi:MAG: TOBE domain-containing protein, partial [Candidatus Competibacterales bacterium]|nr:TOBE domain-containing protein [Candidatus Competibacterales bacterium]
ERIAVMKDGEIQQFGTPHEVYDDPANLFVAGFMGSPSMNFIRCELTESADRLALRLDNPAGAFDLPVPGAAAEKLRTAGSREIILGLRPEHITDAAGSDDRQDGNHVAPCRVEITEPTGPDTLVFIQLNDGKVVCRARPDNVRGPGESMDLMFNLAKAVYFDPQSERRLA